MEEGIFLDASILENGSFEEIARADVKQNNLRFVFPEGFTQIPLIEECRAMNALDIADPDNFDLLFDITMQMLTGKPVEIYFVENNRNKYQLAAFLVTDRYMNLRGVDIIDEYPIIVNWLVEFVTGYLAKKFPRSSRSIKAVLNARKERMKSLMNQNQTQRL